MSIITYIDDGTYITDVKAIESFLKDIFKVRSDVPDSWVEVFEFLDSVIDYISKRHRYTVKQRTAVSNIEQAIINVQECFVDHVLSGVVANIREDIAPEDDYYYSEP
jgi:hypothetical protein